MSKRHIREKKQCLIFKIRNQPREKLGDNLKPQGPKFYLFTTHTTFFEFSMKSFFFNLSLPRMQRLARHALLLAYSNKLTPSSRTLCCRLDQSRWLSHSHRQPRCNCPVYCELQLCKQNTPMNKSVATYGAHVSARRFKKGHGKLIFRTCNYKTTMITATACRPDHVVPVAVIHGVSQVQIYGLCVAFNCTSVVFLFHVIVP